MPETKKKFDKTLLLLIISAGAALVAFLCMGILAAEIGKLNKRNHILWEQTRVAQRNRRNLKDEVRILKKKVRKIHLTIHMVEEACRLEENNKKELQKQGESIRILWDRLFDVYVEEVCYGKQ